VSLGDRAEQFDSGSGRGHGVPTYRSLSRTTVSA
jgi:hypothetical protein